MCRISSHLQTWLHNCKIIIIIIIITDFYSDCRINAKWFLSSMGAPWESESQASANDNDNNIIMIIIIIIISMIEIVIMITIMIIILWL